MRKMILIFIVVFAAIEGAAQNVGIGTTSPDSKALLDITSTTKGVLFPRMTTSQRLAITTTPNGLMVYDTDKNEFYHYNGSGWRPILNGDYWIRPITSRRRISNAIDSVGIGTNSPTEWLDVDGNIRSRNNILADNNLSAGSISTPGNIIVAGTSVLSGDVTTNGDLTVNNTTATLQLKSSSVNKGFLQLSGDNVRMGTNSGNTTGNLVIRMNGTDRVFVDEVGRMGIGTSSLTSRLHVSGDLDVSDDVILTNNSSVTRPVTGSFNLLPIAYGKARWQASSCYCTGNVTVTRIALGEYEITSPQFGSNTVIVITMNEYQGGFYVYPNVENWPAGSATYKIFFRTVSGTHVDAGFSFVAYQ
jgi:hypothetical protein